MVRFGIAQAVGALMSLFLTITEVYFTKKTQENCGAAGDRPCSASPGELSHGEYSYGYLYEM